ncbi:MAG: DUF1538 domain-containing protein [Nitrospinota bacterium]|nr:DUF1538 domain-containing protein [Nitrospinota bacterium]
MKSFRYGEFIGESSVSQRKIKFNDLVPPPTFDSNGKIIPHQPPKLRLSYSEAAQILAPYVSVRLLEQIKSVLPLGLYMAGFQVLILRMAVEEPLVISIGFILVIVGLMLFLEGIKQGLMPFAETIGDLLPKKSPLWMVLLIAFLLGIGVTLAEPAIGALKAAGSIVDVNKAPQLYAMLNIYTGWMVLVVGAGVGLATVLGSLRFLYGLSLKPFIYSIAGVASGLTFFMMGDPALEPLLGVAWDCGAVTTGPVTVPIVLALGIGIASSAGRGGGTLSGFGIVTLASLLPVVGIMILGVHIAGAMDQQQIISFASASGGGHEGLMNVTPLPEIFQGLRAIVPLVLFLYFILKYVVHSEEGTRGYVSYGLILSLLGLIAFNIGLSYGLVNLGNQAGAVLPSAFAKVESVVEKPLYGFYTGLLMALLFAWALGFSATLAEPALAALGITVENLTNGAFSRKALLYTVASGVAFGVTLGLVRIVFAIPLGYMIIPGYLLCIALTMFSSEELVNVAWDSAGVTTGPVTVPVVLAIGLGFGGAVNAVEGFGILAMASVAPIASVLGMGIIVNRKVTKSHGKK